jgi:hypothetical protein
MITMDRGGSLMKAAGHDQRTLKSSPAQMAAQSPLPGASASSFHIGSPEKVLGAQDQRCGRAAERLNQA